MSTKPAFLLTDLSGSGVTVTTYVFQSLDSLAAWVSTKMAQTATTQVAKEEFVNSATDLQRQTYVHTVRPKTPAPQSMDMSSIPRIPLDAFYTEYCEAVSGDCKSAHETQRGLEVAWAVLGDTEKTPHLKQHSSHAVYRLRKDAVPELQTLLNMHPVQDAYELHATTLAYPETIMKWDTVAADLYRALAQSSGAPITVSDTVLCNWMSVLARAHFQDASVSLQSLYDALVADAARVPDTLRSPVLDAIRVLKESEGAVLETVGQMELAVANAEDVVGCPL